MNAAGSWADQVALLAGVRPLGLEPMRRTIITFDAPPGTKLEGLPFAKTVGDELYFAPESGRLFASPMDEVPSEPCDAQRGELEVALAAHRNGGADDCKGGEDPGPVGGAPDVHPGSCTQLWVSRRCGKLLLAGGPGRVPGSRPRRRWRGITTSLIAGRAVANHSEVGADELSPDRFLGQGA